MSRIGVSGGSAGTQSSSQRPDAEMRPPWITTPASRRSPRSGHQSRLALRAIGESFLGWSVGLGTGFGDADRVMALRVQSQRQLVPVSLPLRVLWPPECCRLRGTAGGCGKARLGDVAGLRGGRGTRFCHRESREPFLGSLRHDRRCTRARRLRIRSIAWLRRTCRSAVRVFL